MAGDGDDTIYTGSGDDKVEAGTGNDLIIGGEGAGDDSYDGGTGVDTIKYTSANDDIVVDLAKGIAGSKNGGDKAGIGSDTLTGIESVIGSYHDDILIGDRASNTFTGTKGNDVIHGGEGSDTAKYLGNMNEYAISQDAKTSYTIIEDKVANRDGIDMLKSIETLNFNDISINTSELIKNTEPIEKNDPIKTNDPVKGVNVYRFYHSDRGIHFYTPSVAERDQITGNPNWGYNYEGVAYQSISESGTQLFRFYHASKGYHFLTRSEEEANNIIKHSIGEGFDVVTGQGITASNNGWGYTYEGRSFRVSSEKTENTSTEVHRFYHAQRGVHFSPPASRK